MNTTRGETDNIRVLIVDDHPIVRSGLELVMQSFSDLQLVGEASSGEEAIQLCGRLHPDVVLMDIVMPEMDGAEATRLIRRTFPEIQIIALTSFPEEELVQSALRAGAIGYLLKNVSGSELASAIRLAKAGKPTLSPEVTQASINVAGQTQSTLLQLTEREREKCSPLWFED